MTSHENHALLSYLSFCITTDVGEAWYRCQTNTYNQWNLTTSASPIPLSNSLWTVRRNQPEPRTTQSVALRANAAQWQVLPPLPVPRGTPGWQEDCSLCLPPCVLGTPSQGEEVDQRKVKAVVMFSQGKKRRKVSILAQCGTCSAFLVWPVPIKNSDRPKPQGRAMKP